MSNSGSTRCLARDCAHTTPQPLSSAPQTAAHRVQHQLGLVSLAAVDVVHHCTDMSRQALLLNLLRQADKWIDMQPKPSSAAGRWKQSTDISCIRAQLPISAATRNRIRSALVGRELPQRLHTTALPMSLRSTACPPTPTKAYPRSPGCPAAASWPRRRRGRRQCA